MDRPADGRVCEGACVMDWEILRELCAIPGVSGTEDGVRSWLRERLSGCADEIKEDALGNLIVEKRGRQGARTRLLLLCHMDEPGLMVSQITEDGFLKMEPVGDLRPETLCGSAVRIGEIPGVIGGKPVHLMDKDERAKPVPLDELSIDIGASSKEEAEKYVSPGDAVILDAPFDAGNGKILARALESRAGCALLLSYLLSGPEYDVTAAFCALGQTEFLGAKTAAYAAAPQAVLAIGGLESGGFPGGEKTGSCRVGKGPAVLLMDKGAIYDRAYVSWAMEEAARLDIPVQTARPLAGQNDASQAHSAGAGARAAAIGVPCRYPGGPAGLMLQSDLDSAAKLLAALADRIAGSPIPNA